jgi:hypothetical protein
MTPTRSILYASVIVLLAILAGFFVTAQGQTYGRILTDSAGSLSISPSGRLWTPAPATFQLDSATYLICYGDEDGTVKWERVTRYEVGWRWNLVTMGQNWGTVYWVRKDGREWKPKNIFWQRREQ